MTQRSSNEQRAENGWALIILRVTDFSFRANLARAPPAWLLVWYNTENFAYFCRNCALFALAVSSFPLYFPALSIWVAGTSGFHSTSSCKSLQVSLQKEAHNKMSTFHFEKINAPQNPNFLFSEQRKDRNCAQWDRDPAVVVLTHLSWVELHSSVTIYCLTWNPTFVLGDENLL